MGKKKGYPPLKMPQSFFWSFTQFTISSTISGRNSFNIRITLFFLSSALSLSFSCPWIFLPYCFDFEANMINPRENAGLMLKKVGKIWNRSACLLGIRDIIGLGLKWFRICFTSMNHSNLMKGLICVNERLRREATTYPAIVRKRRFVCHLFFLFSSL